MQLLSKRRFKLWKKGQALSKLMRSLVHSSNRRSNHTRYGTMFITWAKSVTHMRRSSTLWTKRSASMKRWRRWIRQSWSKKMNLWTLSARDCATRSCLRMMSIPMCKRTSQKFRKRQWTCATTSFSATSNRKSQNECSTTSQHNLLRRILGSTWANWRSTSPPWSLISRLKEAGLIQHSQRSPSSS